MKIALFADTYFPQVSGVSTAVDFFYKKLLKRGNEIYLVIPKLKNQKDGKNTLRLRSITANKAFDYRLAIYISFRSLINLFKKDFDIVHGHAVGSISLGGLFFARLKKIPYVYTYHTMLTDYSHYFLYGILRPKTIRKISRISCNACDYIIAPSKKVKEELIYQGVKKPIAVIPTGIDVNKFQGLRKDFLRKKLNIKKNEKILLHTGRLGKEKSVDFLIYAFNHILKKAANTHLVIVGFGTELNYLKNLTKRLKLEKNIHFLGLVEYKKMPFVYNGADIFVFSSKTETQGLVVLEAMAAKLPIVSLDDEALKETIVNNYNGIMVKKNVSDFAEEVLKLLNDKKKREFLGRNAGEKAKEISEESITSLEKIYQKLINKKPLK